MPHRAREPQPTTKVATPGGATDKVLTVRPEPDDAPQEPHVAAMASGQLGDLVEPHIEAAAVPIAHQAAATVVIAAAMSARARQVGSAVIALAGVIPSPALQQSGQLPAQARRELQCQLLPVWSRGHELLATGLALRAEVGDALPRAQLHQVHNRATGNASPMPIDPHQMATAHLLPVPARQAMLVPAVREDPQFNEKAFPLRRR
mmetsp:Transcript_102545/g.289605  ORF Transcript_102545/g.289605 Transcript_102545/m.289605 type:complete len:205 (-) Transcript_102545:608-1222(-)